MALDTRQITPIRRTGRLETSRPRDGSVAGHVSGTAQRVREATLTKLLTQHHIRRVDAAIIAGGGAPAIAEEAGRHADRLAGGAPRRAPAAARLFIRRSWFPAESDLRKSLLQQLHGFKPFLAPLIRQCVRLPIVNQKVSFVRMPAAVVVLPSLGFGYLTRQRSERRCCMNTRCG